MFMQLTLGASFNDLVVAERSKPLRKQRGRNTSFPGNIALCDEAPDRADDARPTEFKGLRALLAKAIDPVTRRHIDGGEGNLVYLPSKIR